MTAESMEREQEVGLPTAGVIRAVVLLPFYPPFLVPLVTLLPLLFMTVVVPGTLGLAHSLGLEPTIYFYAVECVVAFCICFHLAFGPRIRPQAGPCREPPAGALHSQRGGAILVAVVLLLAGVGLAVSVLVIRAIGIDKLELALASGGSAGELRDEILNTDAVPGMIRMLSYLVPGAVVLSLASSLSGVRMGRMQRIVMFAVAFLALGIRSVMYMDRQPIFMAMLLVILVVAERTRWTPGRATGALVLAVMVAASLLWLAFQLAQFRGGELTENNTILHYADLGVANSIEAIRTTHQFSLGGNSIWTALSFVPRGLGLGDVQLPTTDAQWIWNPAANLLCYSYQDFGPFGSITYALMGLAAGVVCRKRVRAPESIVWANAYLWCTFSLLGIWTVPMTRGPEFWAAVVSTTAMAIMFQHYFGTGEPLTAPAFGMPDVALS